MKVLESQALKRKPNWTQRESLIKLISSSSRRERVLLVKDMRLFHDDAILDTSWDHRESSSMCTIEFLLRWEDGCGCGDGT
jgi:hypothetical protein